MKTPVVQFSPFSQFWTTLRCIVRPPPLLCRTPGPVSASFARLPPRPARGVHRLPTCPHCTRSRKSEQHKDITFQPACATHLKPHPLPMNRWRAAIRTGNVAAERMGAPSAVHCARKVAYLGPGEQQTRNSGKRLPLKVLKLSCPSSKQSPARPRHAHRNALS